MVARAGTHVRPTRGACRLQAVEQVQRASQEKERAVAYQLEAFAGVVDEATLEHVLAQSERTRALLERLWAYYRNPITPTRGAAPRNGVHGRWYSQSQEAALPARYGPRAPEGLLEPRAGREAVIENDIGWRVQAMVDFVFGKPVLIRSTARDQTTREVIEKTLDALWENSGGIALLQDFATLGHVYGHVDLILRMNDAALVQAGAQLRGTQPRDALNEILSAVRAMRVDVVEPLRGTPVLDERDCRTIKAYVIRAGVDRTPTDGSGGFTAWLSDVVRAVAGARSPHERRERAELLEIISGDAWHVYDGGGLVWHSTHGLTDGQVPVAHVQNISQPLVYTGVSEVEPLIPLQDELNTRLSDRAHRVTMQSFKMYLAKGIEGFEKVAVGPGQVWYTDNMSATVEAFGGDASSPSEDAHIREIREAMDKISGVPPLSGGVVQGRIGNLTSANALRITLMGLLAKTQRKRVAYGRAIERISQLALTALHNAGVLQTDASDRGVVLHWPDPLPEDEEAKVRAAESKLRLGVPSERVLGELGYGSGDAGVT